ncbi:MAG: hypothetical protein MO852_05895 [Candidatus Devosia euplotis]|nr:hypothetical protein [Candidatus Devosia euplotis]
MTVATHHPSTVTTAKVGLRIDSIGKRFKTATALEAVSFYTAAGEAGTAQ